MIGLVVLVPPAVGRAAREVDGTVAAGGAEVIGAMEIVGALDDDVVGAGVTAEGVALRADRLCSLTMRVPSVFELL
ncbi:MAG: hypothetical protein M3Y06_07085 [Actinomycetota bacterium]|nr:hypothetical protein [Actinomycetota bacterium]